MKKTVVVLVCILALWSGACSQIPVLTPTPGSIQNSDRPDPDRAASRDVAGGDRYRDASCSRYRNAFSFRIACDFDHGYVHCDTNVYTHSRPERHVCDRHSQCANRHRRPCELNTHFNSCCRPSHPCLDACRTHLWNFATRGTV